MGLFNDLRKIGREIANNVSKDLVNNAINQTGTTTNSKSVPATYANFPAFEGIISNLDEKNMTNYTRCTIDYRNVSNDVLNGYISKVLSYGYVQASNVRYDKGNTYIIIEYKHNTLHLVFHIKR